MFDMCDILSICDSSMNVIIVITFISTEVLFDFFRIWTFDDNVKNEIIGRPLVMFVGAGHMEGQRSTSFIDQEMNLAPLFATSH